MYASDDSSPEVLGVGFSDTKSLKKLKLLIENENKKIEAEFEPEDLVKYGWHKLSATEWVYCPEDQDGWFTGGWCIVRSL